MTNTQLMTLGIGHSDLGHSLVIGHWDLVIADLLRQSEVLGLVVGPGLLLEPFVLFKDL